MLSELKAGRESRFIILQCPPVTLPRACNVIHWKDKRTLKNLEANILGFSPLLLSFIKLR